jgi:hypothetical protein
VYVVLEEKKLKKSGMVELEVVVINFAGGTTVIKSITCFKIRIYDNLIRKQEHDLRLVKMVITKVKFTLNEEVEN